MKLFFSLVLGLGFVSIAQAATLVVTNSNGVDSNAIVSSAGLAYQTTGASISVGYFTISDAAIQSATSLATLTTGFQNYGSSSANFTNAGPQNSRGLFTYNIPTTIIGGTGFENKFIYLFIQNAAGTEVAILKTTLQFLASDDPTLPNVTKTITQANIGTVLKGGTGFTALTANNDTSAGLAYNTVQLIPEPSTALLGAVGALGLLRRRRN